MPAQEHRVDSPYETFHTIDQDNGNLVTVCRLGLAIETYIVLDDLMPGSFQLPGEYFLGLFAERAIVSRVQIDPDHGTTIPELPRGLSIRVSPISS